jgi:hypothetical protein
MVAEEVGSTAAAVGSMVAVDSMAVGFMVAGFMVVLSADFTAVLVDSMAAHSMAAL